MAYCVTADINNVFGSVNVNRWADIDNDGNATTISDRIDWAITLAEDFINSAMYGHKYDFPITSETVPALITHITAIKAGLLLHDSRGVEDSGGKAPPLSVQRIEMESTIKNIKRGLIKLHSLTENATTIPKVVTDDD